MTDTVSAGDSTPTRLRALFDRIGLLADAGLTSMEAYCTRVESMHGLRASPLVVMPSPPARRDLDRMSDVIRALPNAPTMGRAIGAAD